MAQYGLTVEQYDQMLADQGGGCAVCERKPIAMHLAVDHCHDSGKVRGILCTQCNQALGQLNENPGLIRKLAQYIEARA